MTNATSPSMAMLQMAAGCWISQAIYVAAKLGIADLLQDGPKRCETLAEATQTNASALYRMLRALASLDVFAEDEDGHFRLTPLAECLRTRAPGSLRAFATMLGEEEHRRPWDDVLYSVRTGQPAFDHVFGMPHFKYFAEHPEAARTFNEGMTSRSGEENDAIVSAFDFSDFKIVIDVGGGQGTLLAAILQASSSTRGVLFDLPHVIATARAGAARIGLAPRCEFRAGDFFDVVPAGGDAYVLKKVIHDWDDERVLSILNNCRKAMPGTGRLLLIEPIVPPGNAPSFNKLLDLLMLIWTSGGKERTEAEHRALLASAGFKPIRIIPTKSPLGIIEAVPQP
jgi:O-methyltransferase domain/Dimerisation domain